MTWSLDNFTFNYGVQSIGDQLRFERDQIAGDPDIAAPEFIVIGDRFIHDLRAEYSTDNQQASFFFGVNNVTDELPSRGLDNEPTGWLGRYFYAGFRVNTDQLGFQTNACMGKGGRGYITMIRAVSAPFTKVWDTGPRALA